MVVKQEILNEENIWVSSYFKGHGAIKDIHHEA